MPDDEKDQPKQTTRKGLTIPVPSRDEFIRNLEKVAPKPKPDPSRPDENGPVE
jgi:hypothetical protein